MKTPRPGFTVWWDKSGDCLVQDGEVIQKRTGTVVLVGSGEGLSAAYEDRSGEQLVAAAPALGCTFVGGSGRNVHSTGLAPRSSGAAVPAGWWRPTVADTWVLGIFTLVVTGPDDATISDGTDVVAILTTGGTAPVGDYDSTAYGETNYGELVAMVGQPFTLAVTGEEGGILGALPECRAAISEGTATGAEQRYVAVDAVNYEGADDPDWTIEVKPDGSAELSHLTDLVAIREAGGLAYDPGGSYAATALGKSDYNLTDEEPVDGEDWFVTVEVLHRAPRAGTIYLKITETGGVLSTVEGPYLATSQPVNTATEFHFPIARSDGYSLVQLHTGPLTWDGLAQLPTYVVADLPAAGAGALALVTDSTVTLAAGIGDVVAGGGTEKTPVWSDGTDWRIG